MKELIGLVLLLLTLTKVVQSQNDEYNLKEVLTDNYNPEVRPVKHNKDILNLTLDMALQQIIAVNEKEESLVVSVFFRQYWTDDSLKWDPKMYGNLTSTNMKPENIWLPDLTLYNNAEKDDMFGGNLDQLPNRVIVTSTGHVQWLTTAIATAKCPMNIRYFPFDEQHCIMKFGLWTYNGREVDLHYVKRDIDLTSYTQHSEWNIQEAFFTRNELYYGCCVEPFPDVTAEIILKRRPLFYILNLLLPMIFIGILTLLAFFLPAESGERISFAVTLMLALTVFMLIVADMIPASSDTVPLLGVFFTAVMIQMVLMVFAMCFTLSLHLKSPDESKRIGKWTRAFVYDSLAYKFGIRKRGGKDEEKPKERNGFANGHANGHAVKENRSGNHVAMTEAPKQTNGNSGMDDSIYSDHTSRLLKKSLEITQQKLRDEEMEKIIKNEFEVCAKTFDVLALIFFGFTFTSILAIYLLSTGA